jgi:hypothetical protein
VHDQEIETFLQIQGFLTPNTVAAVRLIDDENDIFSDARCGLLDQVTSGLPKTPAEVDAHVRSVVAQAVDAGNLGAMSTERKSYIAQLLKSQDGDPSLNPLHDAYIKEITARYQTLTAAMQTADGRASLKAREQARKDRAAQMFDGRGPLPILTPTP